MKRIRKTDSNKKQTITRKKYTPEHRETARKYYLMGLNLNEISKLMDGCPVRTLEKWQKNYFWTELKHLTNIKAKAYELSQAGKTLNEVARILQVSRSTVSRYINTQKQNNRLKNA